MVDAIVVVLVSNGCLGHVGLFIPKLTAAGVLGDNGEHMAHAQTHVARGDDFSSGKEPVLARRLSVVEEGVLVQQHKTNTSHVSLKSVLWMVGGGRGKPGETIRSAARRVELEQKSDTESGTVTIHHRPTEGPNVRAKTERVMTAFVTFMDVPGMVNGVHGVNGVTSGTAQRRADTG